MRRLAGAALWALAAAAAAGAATPEVRWQENALTVRIERVPLEDVLAAVTRETGLEITGEPLDRREVSKRFDALPLPEALRRLVGRQNFVLWYGPDGLPQRLELLGVPQQPPTPARTRGFRALKLLGQHPAVALPPTTAQALGGPSLRLHRVLPGLRHGNAAVRTETATVLLRAVEGSRELLQAFRTVDAGDLARFVMSQAGAHANEVATTLYRTARDPGLKSRLALARGDVLRRTRRGRGA